MVVPYGVLRVGYPYYKTIGMRRLTNWPISVAVGDDDNEVHILCKGDGITFIRRLTLNDDDKGATNHIFFLSLSKICTSTNCAKRNATPDAKAILIEIKSE